MADFRKLSDTVLASPQISTGEIDAAADMGITLIINNRPDGEEPGQPAGAELADYAASKNIKWVSIPISGGFPFEAVQMMASALKDASGTTLAFCRSGTRSTNLWALAEAFNSSTESDSLIAAAAEAGYDISSLKETLDQLYNMQMS